MTDFTAHRHPVLAVACPDCGKAPGVWCYRPSGHRADQLHLSRRVEADRVFIQQHGPDASIEHVAGTWVIDSYGRACRRQRSATVEGLPLFAAVSG